METPSGSQRLSSPESRAGHPVGCAGRERGVREHVQGAAGPRCPTGQGEEEEREHGEALTGSVGIRVVGRGEQGEDDGGRAGGRPARYGWS